MVTLFFIQKRRSASTGDIKNAVKLQVCTTSPHPLICHLSMIFDLMKVSA